MYRSAIYNVPLLNELLGSDKEEVKPIDLIPSSLRRKDTINIPNLDETQLVRHFHRLSQMNYGIDSGIYPLGSCTMKYNPKICEDIASWDNFTCTHPYQDVSTIQGNLEILFELENRMHDFHRCLQFLFYSVPF